jgi:hypothetical protein
MDGARTDSGTLATVVAFVLALTASLLLLVIPVYSSVGGSAVLDGSGETQTKIKRSKTTLLEENGPGVLVVLSVPVLITMIPLLPRRNARRRPWRLASAMLLTVLCILTGFSIGLFYLPAAVALWIAATLSTNAGMGSGVSDVS